MRWQSCDGGFCGAVNAAYVRRERRGLAVAELHVYSMNVVAAVNEAG